MRPSSFSIILVPVAVSVAVADTSLDARDVKPAPIVFKEKPYVRFMVASTNIAYDSDQAAVIDIKNCMTQQWKSDDTGIMQWHRYNLDDKAKNQCQTFQLQRLPWLSKDTIGIRISSDFLSLGTAFGIAFGKSQENGDTGDAKLTWTSYDPVWEAVQQFSILCQDKGGDRYFGRNCLLRLARPGKSTVCVIAPNSKWSENAPLNGPLAIEPCSDTTQRWHLLKADAQFTQESHAGGWAN